MTYSALRLSAPTQRINRTGRQPADRAPPTERQAFGSRYGIGNTEYGIWDMQWGIAV